MPFIKKYLVWILLALTLVATVLVGEQEHDKEASVMVVSHRNREARPMPKKAEIATESTGQKMREPIDEVPKNLFTVNAPEETETIESEPLPQAPANPFTYAGKLLEQDQYTVFLTDGTKNYAVKIGDVLNNTWRIQTIQPPALTLEYLPLKSSVEMNIGASS